MLKILIDDMRNTLPKGEMPDIIIRTYGAAMWMLSDMNVDIEECEIYLDHDLGDPEGDGYKVACMLEECYFGFPGTRPVKMVCVSDNPPGRARINQVIEKIYAEE